MAGKVALIDCGSNKTSLILNCLEQLNKEVIVISFEEFSLKSVSNHSSIIIGGSPQLLRERNITELITSYSFLKDVSIPVLGICFGHQLLGVINGANYYSIEEDRDWQNIEILHSSLLFNGLTQPLIMKEDHAEAIDIPKNFRILAHSKACKNEAMQHKFLPQFGVQFHPEASNESGLKLINNFISKLNLRLD